MKEKNIKKIIEVKELIEKSKAAGKFDLNKLISKDENLLDVGECRKIQIFIGTNEDFEEINSYLFDLYEKSTDSIECMLIEEVRTLIWHFRQLQEEENHKKVEMNNQKRNGLYKIDFPSYYENFEGEDYDYESRIQLTEFFSEYADTSDDEEQVNIIKSYISKLPRKQQIVISEILMNNSQNVICKKYDMSKTAVSNLYVKAIAKLKILIKEKI